MFVLTALLEVGRGFFLKLVALEVMLFLSNGMQNVYKILNIQDKVTMKHFYHIGCDPDLEGGFCAMQCILCYCNGCVE